jgi:hypothetical protein
MTITVTETGRTARVTIAVRRNHVNDDNAWTYQWKWVNLTTGEVHTDVDLSGPATGHDPGPLAMLDTLLVFLGACGEAYGYEMRTGSPSENLDLFPVPMREWCYQHDDEIAMLQMDAEVE